MAFHVACPITCRRICFCALGFPEKLQSEKGRKGFLDEVIRVEEFLRDPWLIRAKGSGDGGTVQVVVPRVVPPPQPPQVVGDGEGFGGGGGDGEELLSGHSKRVALQKRAFVASLAAEDYAQRIENGVLVDISGDTCDTVGEDRGIAAVKIMCRICFYSESEGSERAARMLACKLCNKKYHRSCLKSWGQDRDLFHLSSWVCPCCRTCEICRRTGDSTKFMFCKRCDGAYHCYCQQPPHKNVSHLPYLCPKHTRCHSCGSNVPGNGPSTRWFLSYTCCDACGRLFVKGNYCPVCLKVYRDSESTPMVCCDVCQRWVHCQCDAISDEKYLEFQADGNLYYKCAACRGDCYQVQDDADAVQELWRRRDKADKDQIASFRAAAGLPSHEDTFSISPYSDDEDYSPPVKLKHEYGRSLKFSVKGSAHKTTKSTKEYGKKFSNKKYGKKKYQVPSIEKTESHHFGRLNEGRSFEFSLSDEKNDDIRSYRNEAQEMLSSPTAKSPGNTRERCSINRAGVMKQDFIREAVASKDGPPRVLHIKNSKSNGSELGDGTRKHATKSETVRGTKLVIHLGGRNRNATNSPRSEASSCHREQDLTTSNGSEDTGQQKANDKNFMDERQDGTARLSDSQGDKYDNMKQLKGSRHEVREGSLIKLGKGTSDGSDINSEIGRANIREGYDTPVGKTHLLLGRSTEGSATALEPVTETPSLRKEEVSLRRHSKDTPNLCNDTRDTNTHVTSGLDPQPKDSKPLLKLKFKNPYTDNRSSWVPQGEEEKNAIKGQRSKRKRPSPLFEKTQVSEVEDDREVHQDATLDEVMDVNWILKKLGKDAIGKRVEVHQASDSSWHKGVVTDVVERSSVLTVHLDDGRTRSLELGKQGIRFVTQKQKRSKK